MRLTRVILLLFIAATAANLPELCPASPSTHPSQVNAVLASGPHPSQGQLEEAASYLLSMYNPMLGLVANSEDEGLNPLGSQGVPCNRTYWVYDDNLWAGFALQPFNRSVAENVTKTVERYMERYGRSMLFEAAVGEPIPTTIHAHRDIKVYDGVVEGNRVQVLLDRHQYADNPGIFGDAEEYADLCWYMTLNYWVMGDLNASEHWFRTGEKLWNRTAGEGFYDKAARSEGRYQNFKLGLFLLAQKVTEFQSSIVEEVEATLWSSQNALGGITTQSWLNGSPYGTANAETTAAALLNYNPDLVEMLRKRQSPTAAKLEDALRTIAGLNTSVSSLKTDNTDLRSRVSTLEDEVKTLQAENTGLKDYPWALHPTPLWFIVLSASTTISATATTILAIWVKKQKSKTPT